MTLDEIKDKYAELATKELDVSTLIGIVEQDTRNGLDDLSDEDAKNLIFEKFPELEAELTP